MKGIEMQMWRQNGMITPDKSRVLLKQFIPGSAERIKGILGRITTLSDEEAQCTLEKVFAEFRDRHHDVNRLFLRRFQEVKSYLSPRLKVSDTMRLLIGSYFTCEYSLEAAALFNPSIIPHPDQTGVGPGALRFVMSLRATGEGHISSIEFRTGVIKSDGNVTFDSLSHYVESSIVDPNPTYGKLEFVTKLQDEHALNSATNAILRSLPDNFKRSELQAKIARFKKSHKRLSGTQQRSIECAETLSELNYEIGFPETVPLNERAIFPVSSYESNGIEDARFVRFSDLDGEATYYATYTAYNGRSIMPLLLQTTDFAHFRIRSLSGDAARNKGMALFPRKIKGRYVMISRQDGENLYVAYSEEVYRWRKPVELLKPKFPWEFTQIGNCGSPIETEKGWILLTHGVGPVRKYCIGVILLDLDNPSKVIGRLPEPLIAPDDSEREGYVPNVVYTCGAISHNGNLIIPYAVSDYATRIGTIALDVLLDELKREGGR